MFYFVKNGDLMAITAHSLIGLSLIWDKILLKRPGTQNLFSYVFWLGSLSVVGVLLVPFGYNSPSFQLIAIAFGAGLIHLVGVFFYYATLKHGEASETLAVMGGFSPVATAVIAFAMLSQHMTTHQLLGFLLMTGGGFVMFFAEQIPWKKLLPSVLLAAGFLGLTNVLEKIVYNQTNFITGYVWFAIGHFVGAFGFLIPSSWRQQIFGESGRDETSNRLWYLANRLLAGVGSFLIFYAISLAHPAIVEAISGVRYVIIFLGALLLTRFRPRLLRESFSGWRFVSKTIATGLVIAGLVVMGLSGGSSTSGAVAGVISPAEIDSQQPHSTHGSGR